MKYSIKNVSKTSHAANTDTPNVSSPDTALLPAVTSNDGAGTYVFNWGGGSVPGGSTPADYVRLVFTFNKDNIDISSVKLQDALNLTFSVDGNVLTVQWFKWTGTTDYYLTIHETLHPNEFFRVDEVFLPFNVTSDDSSGNETINNKNTSFDRLNFANSFYLPLSEIDIESQMLQPGKYRNQMNEGYQQTLFYLVVNNNNFED